MTGVTLSPSNRAWCVPVAVSKNGADVRHVSLRLLLQHHCFGPASENFYTFHINRSS